MGCLFIFLIMLMYIFNDEVQIYVFNLVAFAFYVIFKELLPHPRLSFIPIFSSKS